MKLEEIDKTGVIGESYRIEGIDAAQCRSIFLDWALNFPADADQDAALHQLIETYAQTAPDHPMSGILRAGLEKSHRPARRGGSGARHGRGRVSDN